MTDFNTNGLTFDIREEIVVIGNNPEAADYDNPRGDEHGVALVIRAFNDDGDTREFLYGTFPLRGDVNAKREQADKLVERLGVRLLTLGKLPVGFANWSEGRPVYGSPAYQAYGQADDLAWERDMDERGF